MAFRVLVVENDPETRKALGRVICAKLECEVHEAANPAEARRLLEAHTYTLVLSELSFPKGKLEGLSLIERLAEQPSRPGIVATSAYEIASTLAISRGADAFLSKPTQTGELLVVLRKLLDKRIHPPSNTPEAETASGLDALLAEGGTQVFVQPIYRVSSPQVESHPPELTAVELFTHGPAGSAYERPEALFAGARETNRECMLDQYCVPRMLEAAAQIPPPTRLSINVHASTLCLPDDFAQFLIDSAATANIDPQRITLELVEHAPAWNQIELLQTLQRIRQAGFRIALDDMGLGRSNFQMILDVHPDCFKLDRYFVRGCNNDTERRAVIAAIVTLAAELGSEVIAEGVSTHDELRTLLSLGIRLHQGNILCPPKSLAPGWGNRATYDPAPQLPDSDTNNGTATADPKAPLLSDGAQPDGAGRLSAQQPD